MAQREPFRTCCCCACIPTNTTGILESFGKFIKTLTPGLKCFCCCWQAVYDVPNYVQQIENKTNTKTKDDVNIKLTTAVQFQIKAEHTRDAFYSLQDPKKQIESYIDNTIRSYIPKLTLDQVFDSKDEISNAVNEHLSNVMKDYGYDIVNTLLINIELPPGVEAAMNSKNENLQLKLATVEKAEANKIAVVAQAEANRQSTIIAADAEASKILALAKAQADADRMKGEGDALKRMAQTKGLQVSAEILTDKSKLSPNDSMNYVLTSQYMETLDSIGAKNKATVMVPFPNNIGDALRNVMVQPNLMK